MARYRYLCPLRWGDMDAYGHVNNVLFLRYLEEARIAMFNASAPDDGGGLLDTGILVARHEIDYLLPLHYRAQPVPIDVWVTGLGGASFEVCYEVLDPGVDGAADTVYARAESTMVVYDFTKDSPRRLGDVEKSRLRGWEDDPVPLKRARGRASARSEAPS